ncbi:PHB depolymerase family esterase [uncultured Sphingomonas sp.]|uniref:extracellular catalytic domain type 1 short-chain-length polyhydroxyalkanoate depolymerase n=1 Tax=uncultured Sphingomonas sp. TaxID=158754 RepID=UPI0025FB98D5|nr:PHB depolymerase family esterase [uncultured Sphingomonas sp.]
MRSLNDTLRRLSRLRNGAAIGGTAAPTEDRLSELVAFGSNPGALRGRFYLPRSGQAPAALVVVLHGCTQDAAGYDHGSGWSRLADDQGFALLYPEQQRGNNPNLCFNWFNASDTRRDTGEALSIRQMIATMVAAHAIDPARIFVTGLSAGGAMASVMLATYPDVFAGGAIIAGLPYGTAASMPEAFDRMRAHGGPPAAGLGALVTAASPHQGPWPTISIWHGDRDATVSYANSALIVEQWRGLHDVAAEPDLVEQIDGHRRRAWQDAHGRAVIEEYRIGGLGHGTPLSTAGPDACGAAGAYMLEAGISSTRRISDFWGLATTTSGRRRNHDASPSSAPQSLSEAVPVEHRGTPTRPQPQRASDGVGRIIEDALRTAGLMR